MKKTIAVATALLLGTSTFALAAQGYKSSTSSTSSHEMYKSKKMSKGKNKGTVGQARSSTKGSSQTSGTNKEAPKY